MYLRLFSLLMLMAASEVSNGSTSVPSTPDGTYYSAEEELGDGSFSPEALLVINEGVITIYTVHNGAVLKFEDEFTLSGSQIIITSREEEAYECNGLALTMEVESSFNGVEFRNTGDNLQVTFEGQTISLVSANQEDIERITNLPACTKQ